MDETEMPRQVADRTVGMSEVPVSAPPHSNRVRTIISPQGIGQTCATCGSTSETNADVEANYGYVYAIGRIEPRFPTIGVEKEFSQAIARVDTQGLTDRQAFHEVLKQNRYLVRQLCWVFTIQGLATYILFARDSTDFDLLLETLRRNPSSMDLDIVIGVRGPIAPPEMCNGLTVPIVRFDQLYSFDRESLLKSIPRPQEIPEEQFHSSTGELFDRILQMTDNAGTADDHRALNYLSMRYPAIYAHVAESHRRDTSLTAVEVRTSPLSNTRKIVDVIFSYTNRNTDVVAKFSVRVDVTEEFPFLITKLSPYLDR